MTSKTTITPATVLDRYEENLMGLPYPVILTNIAETITMMTDDQDVVCTSVPNAEQIALFVAGILCFIPVRLLESEVRMMRRAVGMSMEELGFAIGLHAEKLTQWESGLDHIGFEDDMAIRQTIATRINEQLPGMHINSAHISQIVLFPRSFDAYPLIEVHNSNVVHGDQQPFVGSISLSFAGHLVVQYNIRCIVPAPTPLVQDDDAVFLLTTETSPVSTSIETDAVGSETDPTVAIHDYDGSCGAFGFASYMRSGGHTLDDVEMVAKKFEFLGKTIQRLRTDCSEAYQAVVVMVNHLHFWSSSPYDAMHVQITKLLDNLSAADKGMPRPHDDLLPFGWIDENEPEIVQPSTEHIQTFIAVFDKLGQFEAMSRMNQGHGAFHANEQPIDGVPQVINWLRTLVKAPTIQIPTHDDNQTTTNIQASVETSLPIPITPDPISLPDVIQDDAALAIADVITQLQLEIKEHQLENMHLRRVLWTEGYQVRAQQWIAHCFGMAILNNKTQRNHRLLEEIFELVQKAGCTLHEVQQLARWKFDQPIIGGMAEEAGGALMCLAALCSVHDINLYQAADRELERVWKNTDAIREKFAKKPLFTPDIPVVETPNKLASSLVGSTGGIAITPMMLQAAIASLAKNGSMNLAINAALREGTKVKRV